MVIYGHRDQYTSPLKGYNYFTFSVDPGAFQSYSSLHSAVESNSSYAFIERLISRLQ